MGILYQLRLLVLFSVSFHGFSMVSAILPGKNTLEENSFSLSATVDRHGEWETKFKKKFDTIGSPDNAKINMTRHLVKEYGKKNLVVTMSMKGNIYDNRPVILKFHTEGAKNAVVFRDGMSVRRNREMAEKGYGGILTNRPLRDDEVFEVKIDRLVRSYFASLGIGISRRNPKDIDYGEWMMCGTIMLFNNQVYENGSVTTKHFGPNLKRLKVGDKVGVMKKRNGDVHFFVNGKDLGVAASGIDYPVYGVLDLYGKAVEASLA